MVQTMESYQFVITNLNGQQPPRDTKLKQTIQCLIEEFYETVKWLDEKPKQRQ